jgi:hypothetical protein
MKKILILAGVMSVFAFSAQAQRSYSTYPYWTLSKEIQKMQFRNTLQVPGTITTTETIASSKGVAAHQKQSTQPKVRVKTSGTPSWVISKGVARIQRERVN